MVFYTIEVALASKLFSDIWVSSDSLAYLELCRQAYPEIRCIHRPKELALSTTSSLETLRLLQPLRKTRSLWNLQVTSPLREVEHLIESYQLYCQSGADHLISCVKADKSRSLYLQFSGVVIYPSALRFPTLCSAERACLLLSQLVVSGFLCKDLYLRDETFTRIRQ